jgi:hypothetical protein
VILLMPYCFVPFCSAVHGGIGGSAMCVIPEGGIVRVLQDWPFNFSRDAAETIVYNPHTHIVCVHHVDTRQLDLFTLQDVHNDPVVSAIIAGTRLPQPSCLPTAAGSHDNGTVQGGVCYFLS